MEAWKGDRQDSGNFPVVGVSWYEADAYARWFSIKTKKEYALPTEAQWEKAARGTAGFVYPWGKKFDKNLCNSNEGGLGRTSPVGTFPGGESPYGCLDMAGNVLEWCADWYDWYGDDYYKDSPAKNPPGPLKGSRRVVRSGCWFLVASDCRAAFRHHFHPVNRAGVVGFRLVRLL